MGLFSWFFFFEEANSREEETRNGYKKVKISDVCIGDEIMGLGIVTDKYKFLGDWAVWCGYKEHYINKHTKVWVK